MSEHSFFWLQGERAACGSRKGGDLVEGAKGTRPITLTTYAQ
jgi:hypothetical protein